MLFQRQSTLGFRFVFLLFLSISLMIYDQRYQQTERIHAMLTAMVTPFQYTISSSFNLFGSIVNALTTNRNLLKQNNQLESKILLQQAQIQQIQELEQENNQLRRLLNSSSYLSGNVKVAQILAVDTDSYLAQAIIDQGKDYGTFVGQPVIDAEGIIGQIIQVGPLTSRVMLITDTRSAVPVQDQRTGVHAIAVGTGPQRELSLINVPETADIKVGDRLLTSGLDLLYPVGYPLGIVTRVDYHTGELFVNIHVKPAANLNQSRQVLLMWLPAKAVYTEAKQDLVEIAKQKQNSAKKANNIKY